MEPVKDAAEAVAAASTMLNNFDIPKGVVREGATAEDFHLGYTQWSVIADTRHKVYYYWTMYDRRMRSVDFSRLDFNAKKTSAFPLDRARVRGYRGSFGRFFPLMPHGGAPTGGGAASRGNTQNFTFRRVTVLKS